MNQQQAFFYHALALFGNFCIFLFLSLVDIGLFLIFFQTMYLIFESLALGLLILTFMYGAIFVEKYRNIRANIDNFFTEELPKLELTKMPGDAPLKAVFLYRNGATLQTIKEDFHLSHPTQARRLLIEGLDILLKEHEKAIQT